VRLGTIQSLQNQFVKAVAADGVHIIAPYVKIITCIYSLRHLQNYSQMQNEATDCCCQDVFENQSLTNYHANHHAPEWFNGERHYAGVY